MPVEITRYQIDDTKHTQHSAKSFKQISHNSKIFKFYNIFFIVSNMRIEVNMTFLSFTSTPASCI